MSKWLISMMAAGFLMVSVLGLPMDASAEMDGVNDVELSAEQKDEMAKLQQKALEQKVEIINKYVEYGVFTEEKGKKIISFMEKHHEKLAEDGFIPKWDKKKRHNCHDHDE
ncbi:MULTISPECIES: YckD family protein [Bacillaceae]|uniref:YckD family protein n=1 Tax=Evansella alkalicola TaxID=745819 RepID=A0ABS6JWI8_9BACI|nr:MULTISPECIES: YckD family protein [Bacillaceae]MBU9722853.1 YckD family protein [Bacillus alkalicola]